MGSSSKNKPPEGGGQKQPQQRRPQGPLQGAGPQNRPYGLPDIPIGMPINPADAGTGAAGTISPQGDVYGGGVGPGGGGTDPALLRAMLAKQMAMQQRSDQMAVGGRGARGMGGAFGNGSSMGSPSGRGGLY